MSLDNENELIKLKITLKTMISLVCFLIQIFRVTNLSCFLPKEKTMRGGIRRPLQCLYSLDPTTVAKELLGVNECSCKSLL